MAEKAYEKHAWILLFAVGIFGLISALNFLLSRAPLDPQLLKNLTGITWEELLTRSPGYAEQLREISRAFGIVWVGLGLFTLTISRVSYRTGERWAWYVLWYLPVGLLGLTANSVAAGGGRWPLFLVVAIVALMGLLLPYRKFFPRK